MEKFEKKLFKFLAFITEPLSRISFFIVYFYFGTLKIVGASPATPLVKDLFKVTLSGILDFPTFYAFFTLFEILIGVLFLFPKLTKITFVLFFLHMLMVMSPLVLLGEQIWSEMGVLTIEGQYVLKDLILLSLGLFLLKSNKDSPY